MGGMYAVTIPQPGGPEVLTWAEVPDPRPAPGEVLITIAATAINRADLLQREGHYPPPPGAPPYPGLECSGWIAEVGPEVSGWQVGDEVCALLNGGGYAEKVAVAVEQVLPVPTGIDLVDAAALPEVAATVWSNLIDVARLRPGETLLVHGGGSGIGTFAIQFATAFGATVLTTARATKHGALRSLGASATIDYTTTDFAPAVQAATDGRGADVILDIMGGPYLAPNLQCLATDGRLVIIAIQGGRRADLDLAAMLSTRATIAATSLRTRPLAQKASIVAALRAEMWPHVAGGSLRPIIDRYLPLSRAAEAHRAMGDPGRIGKIVLVAEGHHLSAG